MARAKRAATPKTDETPAPSGHNAAPLSEDEQAALTVYHELKIIEAQRKVDALKVDLDSARSVVNGHFKRMTADLNFTRKEFEAEVIVLGRMTEAQYLNAERRRARLHRLAGRNPGEQLDLIEALQDTVAEAQAAEHDGYRAGRRADDPVPPKEVSPILHPDWMRGWHAGQEYNGAQLIKAHEVLARPKPGELAAAPQPATEADPEGDFDPDQGARALKASGWTEPTADEQAFDQAAA